MFKNCVGFYKMFPLRKEHFILYRAFFRQQKNKEKNILILY